MPASELITMSASELDRLTILERVGEGRLTQVEAGRQLGITPRQVRRLLAALKRDGPRGVVSKKRGKPSNRSYATSVKTWVVELIREQYADFGPTLVAEMLAERHEVQLSRETLRRWLLEAGLWKDRKQRAKPVHQSRYRRDCLGELR